MSEAKATCHVDARLEQDELPSYKVSELARGDEAHWDAFVRRVAGGTFYHLAGWRTIIENRLHHPAYYLVCETRGEICALLPLVHLKSRLFGNSLISLPFLVYGGPLAETGEAERLVVARARELALELDVDYLELRNQRALDETLHGSGWHSEGSHVNFSKALDPDPERNLKAIPRKQRAMIRKGMDAGLSFQMDEDATRLYGTLLECKRNLGTPFFDQRYLQAIKDTFADQAEILTVMHGSDVVCSVMSFRYGERILPYYGGGGALARNYRGNDYMYWCVMEKACREGFRVFDYGRSLIGSGAYDFKKHWGFEPEPLAYQRRLVRATEMRNLTPSNPKFRLAIAAWKRLPLPLAGLIGPHVARRLG